MSLYKELQKLFQQYGYTQVYKKFLETCREEYEYLQTIERILGEHEGYPEAFALASKEERKEEKTPEAPPLAPEAGEALAREVEEAEAVKTEEETTEAPPLTPEANEATKEKRKWPFFNRNGIKRERKKEFITKENFKKWIEEGKGYTTIGELVGMSSIAVKNYCIKHGIDKSTPKKKWEQRREIPEDYAEILKHNEKKEAKLQECRTIIQKKCNEANEALPEAIGIYGIYNKNTNECIYIGSTDNFVKRYTMHKEKYEAGQKQHLFDIIQKQGGWENHQMIPLEIRNNDIGLYIIEAIWWESVKPIGNKISPITDNYFNK
jgi:hypothetical protein